ncbi:MAG: iron-containing alcohol dehydrogenase, partial [candidate division NC10 bacterium]
MSQSFVHLPVDRVTYGAGALADLPREVERLGKRRAFVITGNSIASKTGLLDRVVSLLGDRCAGTFAGSVQHVPKRTILEAAAGAREAQADCLVSLGGGSPIDTTKAGPLKSVAPSPV